MVLLLVILAGYLLAGYTLGLSIADDWKAVVVTILLWPLISIYALGMILGGLWQESRK